MNKVKKCQHSNVQGSQHGTLKTERSQKQKKNKNSIEQDFEGLASCKINFTWQGIRSLMSNNLLPNLVQGWSYLKLTGHIEQIQVVAI